MDDGQYSWFQWRSQVTDDARALHVLFFFFYCRKGGWGGGGGLRACSPSNFLLLRLFLWDYIWNAVGLESGVVLTYDFSIRARIGNCTIANSYTMKGQCSTVYRTLTPRFRPGWARVWLRPRLVLWGNTVKTLYHTSSKTTQTLPAVSTRPCVYMADLETYIVYSDIPNINIHRLWFSLKLFF